MTVLSIVEKSLIQAVVTSAITSYAIGDYAVISVPWTNYSFSAWQTGAIVGASSSLLSDSLHYIVKKEIPLHDKVNDMASMGLGIVSSGLAFNGALYLMYQDLPEQYGLLKGMVSGAVAEYSSSFIYNLLKSYSFI